MTKIDTGDGPDQGAGVRGSSAAGQLGGDVGEGRGVLRQRLDPSKITIIKAGDFAKAAPGTLRSGR